MAEKIEDSLDRLNEQLEEMGMLKLAIISPYDCKPQKKNARYFEAEKFQQLVNNIKDSGTLESIPLVHKVDDDTYEIISGHHRIDAAKQAGLEKIMVMVDDPGDRDDVVYKQLAHNALAGKDDEVILYELFQSIEDVSKRMATGLADEMDKISYESLNFRVGSFKTFTVLFLPEDVGLYDETIELIEDELSVHPDEELRIASIETFDKFAKAIRTIKRCENIKNNGVALMRMVDLANEQISELKEDTYGKEK